MLYLHKRGNYWHIAGSVSFANRLVTVRKSTRQTTRRQAEEVCRYVEQTIINDMKGNTSMLPFVHVADDWLSTSPRHETDILYAKKLQDFFRTYSVDKINNKAWNNFKRDNLFNYKSASINRVRSTLLSILKHADIKPKLTKEKVINDRIRFLTYQQQEQLLQAYPDFIRPLFITLCYQGLRIGEAHRLRSQFINFDNKTIFVDKSKTEYRRIIPMHPRVVETLLPLNNRDFLFLNSRGKRYASPKNVRSVHETALKKCNMDDFHIHDWRHHWASTLIMNGASIPAMMKLGGWQDERMVMRYADVSNEHIINTVHKMP